MGVIYTVIFSVVICIYVLILYFIGYNAGTIQPYYYPLTPTNIFGTLGFQLFLSGPSEEILFRALPITIFLSLFEINANERNCNIMVIVLSCTLFSLAHISLSSPALTIDWFQLAYSMSNVLMVGVGYLFMAFY